MNLNRISNKIFIYKSSVPLYNYVRLMLRRKVARDGETSLVKTQPRYKPYALT